MTIQEETLPSIILGDTQMYTTMRVPLHVYIIHNHYKHAHCKVTLPQYSINARSSKKI